MTDLNLGIDVGEPVSENLFSFTGTVKRIRYKNPENGYCIIAFLPEGSKQEINVIGIMPNIQAESKLNITAEKTVHKQYGEQYTAKTITEEMPQTDDGLKSYLGSGMIHGIGKEYAKRIVKQFGGETVNILDNNPDQLKEVAGLGGKRIEKIKESWKKHRAVSEIIIALQSCGISSTWAMKIYKEYKDRAVSVIKANPYQLAIDIRGIGFTTADAIAAKTGIDKLSDKRIEAGVIHVLNEAAGSCGHVYLPMFELMGIAKKLLDAPEQNVLRAIESLEQQQKLFLNAPEGTQLSDIPVYLKSMFEHENNISGILREKSSCDKKRHEVSDEEIKELERKYEILFAPQQKHAIRIATGNNIAVITGGPGTGKTTITKSIVEILESKKEKILLASPTGRAAKRFSEATGRPAKTIHRVLEYKQNMGFSRNENNPLEADCIIIDEASMLDVFLADTLLKAVGKNTSIIFVGDIDQLPSVGAGNFLRDLIECGQIPVSRLEFIFRQAQQSRIKTNAHKINHGEMPDTEHLENSDFFFFQKEEPAEAIELIKSLISKSIPECLGISSTDIQILSPMNKGILGVGNLNTEIQKAINPHKTELQRGFLNLKVNDKVIQRKNNYDKNVFNGDIGIVKSIDIDEEELVIDFDGTDITYTYEDLEEISLAYAITVHKSQGSEYPAVIIPIHTQHFIMLQRNLLYTALTRGKRLVVIVGTKKALGMAVRNNDVKKRYSGLCGMLAGEGVETNKDEMNF